MILTALFMVGVCVFQTFGVMNASVSLHGNLLSTVLKSPMSFFDTTPLGRIVNR